MINMVGAFMSIIRHIKEDLQKQRLAEAAPQKIDKKFLRGFIKKQGRPEINGFLANGSAHEAADDWKTQDFYDMFLDGIKGYSQYSDAEIVDELEGRHGRDTMEDFLKHYKLVVDGEEN